MKSYRYLLDILLYIIVFLAVQAIFAPIGVLLGHEAHRLFFENAGHTLVASDMGLGLVIGSTLAALATLIVFVWTRWFRIDNTYIRQRPWFTLFWVVTLALGAILPMEWLIERMNITMPHEYEQLFRTIMSTPGGYLDIGIMAPIVEEIVFRGCILSTLLTQWGHSRRWAAIVVSALLFGAIHFNLPQFVNASLLGLILGWLYYRSGSIVPGMLFHWTVNTVAYLMFKLMPDMADGKLIDYFHGNDRMMYLGLFFSLCIFLPSIFQLNKRLTSA